jgi:AraC-like DNA-binding protein
MYFCMMDYREITPQERLKPFIKCFYLFQSNSDTEFDDVVFPSGFTEIVFNLGEGSWASFNGKEFITTPKTELWGQVTLPLQIRSKGKQLMLGARFFQHAAGYFLKENIAQFNDRVTDFSAILGASVKALHATLLETNDLMERIRLIEDFLLNRLSSERKLNLRITEVGHILQHIISNSEGSSTNLVASQHGITSRYLHKLIYEHTGLSPKVINRINRFQLSLKLIARNKEPLTAIAYDCGYFDQSHFIRDFKSFTGVTPSEFAKNKFPVNQAFFQN